MGNRDELIAIIESVLPERFSVLCHKLPDLGPSDSKRNFKKTVSELITSQSLPDEGQQVSATVDGQDIELTLIPRLPRGAKWAGGPSISIWGDGAGTIRKAIRRKRRQVRGVRQPVILAVNASELVSDLEDFDTALFGHETLYLDHNAEPIKTEFKTSGVLTLHGSGSPTYAAVLAFIEVGFRCTNEPVLYHHPRFSGSLPTELSVLQSRRLIEGKGIEVAPASNDRLLDFLQPVRV